MKLTSWPPIAFVMRDRILGIKAMGLRTNNRSLVHNCDGVLGCLNDLMKALPEAKEEEASSLETSSKKAAAPPKPEIVLPPILKGGPKK